MYVATATGDLGYVTSLQTNQTIMEAKLPCGQLFTFTVTAHNDQCDGPVSPPQKFKTGRRLTDVWWLNVQWVRNDSIADFSFRSLHPL